MTSSVFTITSDRSSGALALRRAIHLLAGTLPPGIALVLLTPPIQQEKAR